MRATGGGTDLRWQATPTTGLLAFPLTTTFVLPQRNHHVAREGLRPIASFNSRRLQTQNTRCRFLKCTNVTTHQSSQIDLPNSRTLRVRDRATKQMLAAAHRSGALRSCQTLQRCLLDRTRSGEHRPLAQRAELDQHKRCRGRLHHLDLPGQKHGGALQRRSQHPT